ncbi:unnamed protein product [Rotaria sordida]|uniref:Uncharacterized protein n=1 Tax=Rotaria sordida TaxID=392033 RepID=A0A815WK38_9BILA|nr:unnamed protein product [Rotaria sordida]
MTSCMIPAAPVDDMIIRDLLRELLHKRGDYWCCCSNGCKCNANYAKCLNSCTTGGTTSSTTCSGTTTDCTACTAGKK